MVPQTAPVYYHSTYLDQLSEEAGPEHMLLQDVAQAEASLMSAHANLDAARAAFLPGVSLTAGGGPLNCAGNGGWWTVTGATPGSRPGHGGPSVVRTWSAGAPGRSATLGSPQGTRKTCSE